MSNLDDYEVKIKPRRGALAITVSICGRQVGESIGLDIDSALRQAERMMRCDRFDEQTLTGGQVTDWIEQREKERSRQARSRHMGIKSGVRY